MRYNNRGKENSKRQPHAVDLRNSYCLLALDLFIQYGVYGYQTLRSTGHCITVWHFEFWWTIRWMATTHQSNCVQQQQIHTWTASRLI